MIRQGAVKHFVGFFFFIFTGLTLTASAVGDAVESVEEKLYRLKGQGELYRNFETLNVDRWLDSKHWRQTLKYSQKDREAEIERDYREEVARVISCIGSCRLKRGLGEYELSYRSLILEGDTLETAKGSYLWLVLKNGNLIRLSSLTLVQIPEMNITAKRVSIVLHLVRGFIHHLDRRDDPIFISDSLADTDPVVFPLRYPQANKEFYWWKTYQKAKKKKQSKSKKQIRAKMREELFELYQKEKVQADHFLTGELSREYFIHTAHGDFILQNKSFMLGWDSLDGGIFWRHGVKGIPATEVTMQQRQAKAFEEKLKGHRWYQIIGGKAQEPSSQKKIFLKESYLVKRLVALRLVRDVFFNKYFYRLFEAIYLKNHYKVAEWGARLWQEEELDNRISFLRGYYHLMGRRWLRHAKKHKEAFIRVPWRYLNDNAWKAYYQSLAEEQLRDHPMIKKLNETQFYFWLHRQMKGNYYPSGVLNP